MKKTMQPTKEHPDGGIWVKAVVRSKITGKPVKREKTIWAEDFPTKTEMKRAADRLEVELFDLARQEATRVDTEAKKSKGKVWTLKTVAEDRIAKYGDTSMTTYFRSIIDLAGSTIPEDFEKTYWATIKYLQDTPYIKQGSTKEVIRSESTINRYRSVFRLIFNHARQIKALPDNTTITDKFDYGFDTEEGRDRTWTPEEKERIFAEMEKSNSWLTMAVYFASINPIRAGDLFGDEKRGNPGLRKSNWNPAKNWVEFLASKTGRGKKSSKEKRRPTYLKQVDERIRNYFESLPENCDQLFPRITKDGFGYPVKCYKDEWERICREAKVEDFRFHDLKHCAITFLLDHGYSKLDLENCGIQYSKEMIKRYYHFDADKAPVIAGFEKPELKVFNTRTGTAD